MSDLHDTDKKLIWHPFTSLVSEIEPVLIQSAEGIYLTTDDGRKIIDAVSSWWVNIHGHSNSFIAEAIAKQANKLEHVIFAGFTHEPAITLAKNLISILPTNQSKIFFSDNGSTAVEVGLKMAYQFWYNRGIEKKKIVAIDGSYHGDTMGAMSVGERSPFTNAFSPLLFDVEFIDFPSADKEDYVVEQFNDIARQKNVGVFIFEPLVQGAAGMRMYSPAVLDRLIQIAHENNIICVADEVFTGFGRTGKLFASHYLKNQPDIIAVSKGITGGTMALGVTSCSDKIVKAFESADVLKTFFHGHSYTANPIACAAANASFTLLMRDDCQQNIRRISSQHESFKQKIKSNKAVKEVRNIGTIIAIELASQTGTSYFNEIRKRIYPFFLERNILLRPLGNVIYILPPYIIKEKELDEVYRCVEMFLESL